MVKNKKGNSKNGNLGRHLIKQQNASRKTHKPQDSWLHTSEIQDGSDWNRLNLQSVTERNTLEEFLETAELAGVEFTAEKLNVKIVGTGTITGVLGEADKRHIKKLQEEKKKFVTIPRRPLWNQTTSAEELQQLEREAFLTWRREMSLLQENEGLLLTPYEKNLDVWRQLWRVIERSDVVCQIVDARNPLLFKCDDLEKYVHEVNPEKGFIVIVNKADYLTDVQRKFWADYFSNKQTKIIFWSALEQSLPQESDLAEKIADSLCLNVDPENNNSNTDANSSEESVGLDQNSDDNKPNTDKISEPVMQGDQCDCPTVDDPTMPVVMNRKDLIKHFKSLKKVSQDNNYVTVGLVGYPNVGKSSTINALMQEKKTSVSATPGKTKHFQTLFIDDKLCLCDCPGLVFPTFISTKAEMVLNGILPIDQLRDHVAPTTILSQMIPRKVIENTYGINIAKPRENENQSRPPTAEELLSSYANMRGFMTASGTPDCPRASRYILKDFIKGKLLYCHPPPGLSEEDFESVRITEKVLEKMAEREVKELKKAEKDLINGEFMISEVDEDFFTEKSKGFYFKTPTGTGRPILITNDGQVIDKPWKKHFNRNKKEKLRRLHDKKT